MKIYVSMIALNEAQYIHKAVSSCGFADEIVVVDGGSEDGTTNLIHIAAQEIGVVNHTIERLWGNHFGNQRQLSLLMVSDEADWWVRLDSDEVYPPVFVENIRSLLESVPDDCLCVRIRQVNLVDDSQHYSAARGGWETWPRIFRNIRLPDGSPAWKWIGQVHETPRLMGKTGLVDPEPITFNLPVIHYGWLSDTRRQEREELYVEMNGSGFKAGSLTKRTHVVRELP